MMMNAIVIVTSDSSSSSRKRTFQASWMIRRNCYCCDFQKLKDVANKSTRIYCILLTNNVFLYAFDYIYVVYIYT